jgi:hypothetical protein
MRHSSVKDCLKKQAPDGKQCDECEPGCPFYGDQSGEEEALLEALSAELEKLAEEQALKNKAKQFVFFIK